MPEISWEDFEKVDVRVGRGVDAGPFPEARPRLPPKRIAGFESEVLVLGVPDEKGAVVLIAPDREVPSGARIF